MEGCVFLKKGIIIVLVVTLICVVALYLYEPKPIFNERYSYVEDIYNSGQLIGKTRDECGEILGYSYHLFDSVSMYDNVEYSSYSAGSQVFPGFLGDTKDYAIEIFFDENGIAMDAEIRQIP